MHPALRLRKLSQEQRSIIGALISCPGLGSNDLMRVVGFTGSRASFSGMTSTLQDYGLIVRSGRQGPWSLTKDARRFAVAPQMRDSVPFNDARVIGHGKPFLSEEQVRRLEDLLPSSKTDAATFIRALSERFIIDLSWASSNLEGNTYDYLDTENLIRFGQEADDKEVLETAMILNHKRAVEWLLDVAQDGKDISADDVCVLHAHLMRGLLPVQELGAMRNHRVTIGGSSYRPSGDHLMLRAGMMNALNRARETANPHEASLGILAGMSYLQAFSDGNKRTARLLASIPLLRAGMAPLSFVGWEKQEYTVGLVVFYETGDPSVLAEGFVKNQIDNSPVYHDLIRAHRVPHRLEVTHRKEIAEAVTTAIRDGVSAANAVESAFQSKDRESAILLVEEVMAGISKANAAAWGVDPNLVIEDRELEI